MKQILVIADLFEADQTAYAKALQLAKLTSSKIHVVMLCYESVVNAIDKDYELEAFNLRNQFLRQKEQWLSDFIKESQPSVEVTYEVVWEKYLHRWVLKHCKENQYDLIVKTGHRSETPFHTPADWHLFRKSDIPIYSVNAKPYRSRKVVLAALDLATRDAEKYKLNARLLEEAFRLSVHADAELHCCYAIKIPTLVKDMDLIDVAAHARKQRNLVRDQCQSWLDEYEIDEKSLHINDGTPWRIITQAASNLKAQCIVIGSMGRKGVPGKLIGNTAEKVIHHSKSDLLVVTPDESVEGLTTVDAND